MNKTKVLIVDDSLMMRKIITDIVTALDEIEVVGTAKNGEEALVKTEELQPDIVLLDIEMPIMTGLEFLEAVRLKNDAKVIVLSSLTQIGSPVAAEARALGAVDVVAKPSGGLSLDLEQRRSHEIVTAIKNAINR